MRGIEHASECSYASDIASKSKDEQPVDGKHNGILKNFPTYRQKGKPNKGAPPDCLDFRFVE
jgi:hypothetical protein